MASPARPVAPPRAVSVLCVMLSGIVGARRMNHETLTNAKSHDSKKNINCWTAGLANLFTDVDVTCGFPPEATVEKEIRRREKEIVTITSETYIHPGQPLNIRTLPERTEELAYGVDPSVLEDKTVNELLVPHNDTCADKAWLKLFPPVESGKDVYSNIKKLVDSFDIYSKCTKVYVPNKDADGNPKMKKDDIIAIVTEPIPGHFTTSYEDVGYYSEFVDNEGTKTLEAVITSRKENVIEGNYDVTLQLFSNGTVRLAYKKRQNLAEFVMRVAASRNDYELATQDSVDRTMLKLAYAGRYGLDAIKDGGCYEFKWCADYFSKAVGELCSEPHECASAMCESSGIFQPKKCVAWHEG